MAKYVIGITGASGSIYAKALIHELLCEGHDLDLIFSKTAVLVTEHELGWVIPPKEDEATAYFEQLYQEAITLGSKKRALASTNEGDMVLRVFHEAHIAAPPASGSYLIDAMIIVPATMGSVSSIATGRSDNLLERAADVTLKEQRKLVIVPRETPMSSIHLENLLTLSKMGVAVIPACPSFYQKPETIDDLVDFLILRILDHLGIYRESSQRWG